MTRDRIGAAREIAGRYGASIVDAPEHGEALAPGMTAIRLRDQSDPNAFAIALHEHRTVVAGAPLMGVPAGALSLRERRTATPLARRWAYGGSCAKIPRRCSFRAGIRSSPERMRRSIACFTKRRAPKSTASTLTSSTFAVDEPSGRIKRCRLPAPTPKSVWRSARANSATA